ncbi:BON domain-containing protein [Rhizobium puerariae]|uniref:BON domain-containing protein n=1 Tax=Rhizobium puerariae TaxID=1585791 RepID=A0ABV6AMQ3_9HYPH
MGNGSRNLLTIRPIAQVPDVKDRIERALKRSAKVEANAIRVEVSGRCATLEGSVHSGKERQAAEQARGSFQALLPSTTD